MLYNLVVGGVVVGLPLAVAGYFAAFWLVEKYRRKVNGRLHLPKIRQRQRATPSELDPDQSDS